MTPESPITPLQSVPPTEQPGLFQRPWFLYFTAISRRLGVLRDAVMGWDALTHQGRIPKVAEAGTLEESAITDDGATISAALPVNTTGVYKVAGTQVVGARGAALTASGIALAAAPGAYNPAFEATVVTICNNLKTRVDELEARLRAHGLIS